MDQQNEDIIQGVYNISEIDKFSIAKIEDVKNSFFLTFNTLKIDKIASQLQDLSSDMLQVIEKYYEPEDIAKNTLTISDETYNFYDLKELISYEDYMDRDTLRTIAEKLFFIYNQYIKQLGVELPTARINVKKKITDRLFGLINKTDAFYKDSALTYDKYLAKTKIKDSTNVYIMHNINNMSSYDLNSNDLYIGDARVGKSTYAIHNDILYFSNKLGLSYVDAYEHMIDENWVFNNVIYTNINALEKLQRVKKEPILFDEMYLLGDRRESMKANNISYTKWVNIFASNNNYIQTLIQNITDLDQRIYSKSNIIRVIYERGNALIYIKPKGFTSLIKDTFDFERFEKYSNLLSTDITALNNLKHIRSFVAEAQFPDLKDNKLFKIYADWKKKNQAEMDSKQYVTSKYDGICHICKENYYKGDVILKDAKGYIHEDCYGKKEKIEIKEQVLTINDFMR
jgi:hypothetical protein